MIKTLTDKIRAEQEKLYALKTKKTEIEARIRKTEEQIGKYRIMEESARYRQLMEASAGSGISVEDILDALKSGDISRLTERMGGYPEDDTGKACFEGDHREEVPD